MLILHLILLNIKKPQVDLDTILFYIKHSLKECGHPRSPRVFTHSIYIVKKF